MLYTSSWARFKLTTSVVIGTDCIGSRKSNYHTIMAMRLLLFIEFREFSDICKNIQHWEQQVVCTIFVTRFWRDNLTISFWWTLMCAEISHWKKCCVNIEIEGKEFIVQYWVQRYTYWLLIQLVKKWYGCKWFFGGVRVAHLFSFLCCPIMCLYIMSSVLWCLHKNDVQLIFTSCSCL